MPEGDTAPSCAEAMGSTNDEGRDATARAAGSPSVPSAAIRRGLGGAFLDFDHIPALLSIAEKTATREQTTAAWSTFLQRAGFQARHIDPDELPQGMSVADSLAADAWRLADRIGWIGADGLTDAGWRAATLGDAGPPSIRSALAPLLAAAIENHLRGENGVPIIPLLRRAAQALGDTTNLWARECPGLIPIEVGTIVYWACVQVARAEQLLDNIVSWRDVAMHPYGAPDPKAPPGANATLHFDAVSEFYVSHPRLGERTPTSFAEDFAMCSLLVYGQLFRELPLASGVFCLTRHADIGGGRHQPDRR